MTERVILERNVPVPMRDGVVLMADVYRPADDTPVPALVQRTPYDKTFHPFTWMMIDPTKMAAAGYAVIIQDVRGRFMSQGEYTSLFTAEPDDAYDTIAWAASQPWCDGTVGMYGLSYMGIAQWWAATRRPPALRAIAPATSALDFYENYLHRGGALQLGHLAAWIVASHGPNALVRSLLATPEKIPAAVAGLIDDMDGLDEHLARVPILPFPPVADRGIDVGFADIARDDVRAPAHDERSLTGRHPTIQVPALQIAGWYDFLLQNDLDHFVEMRARAGTDEARRLTRLVVGPWAHASFLPVVGELDFGFRAAGALIDLREDLTGLHKRWFDARLKGEASGIDDEPPVKLFVMGRNRWRSEDAWPVPAVEQRWHLHAGGALSPLPPGDAEPSIVTLDPDDPVPTTGGQILLMSKYPRGPREQSGIEQRDDVLTFTSEPLATDLEVIGRITFRCWVAAETVDTDVVARLCDVHPTGGSYNVADGILRLRFRDGLSHPKPLTPGEVVQVEVDLWSTAHVFLAGHRVRLQVCASDFPRYDRCPGTGESSADAKQIVPQRNRIFHDPQRPSHVVLPVIEG